ncbi:hypothetical protein CCR87_12300 [Rhodobaculum claviforme]|uniref:Uncharacterized protein n=2 Tax=Rhodobaculum claviforme TaxID=1549854 RepID=A0A934TL27_9RHOB|nr:hypothetical protein [Rhodobaculum claviforme]MBK5928099.1 hypothetical protein [Rhodobaculum claviforme]
MLLIGRLNYSWTNTESLLIHLIAGLVGTTKETAVIIFLTLNTTRARVDLVERLSKMDGRDPAERARVLEVTRRLLGLSGLRNRYNHCIYSFDPDGGAPRTIQMRIADRRDAIKVGQTDLLDAAARADIDAAISNLEALNRAIWALIAEYRYPA